MGSRLTLRPSTAQVAAAAGFTALHQGGVVRFRAVGASAVDAVAAKVVELLDSAALAPAHR